MQPDVLEVQVQNALELCRPALRADGGDVELVSIDPDGVVTVRFTGSCGGCPMSPMTLRAGIERTILHCAPTVKRVEAVLP